MRYLACRYLDNNRLLCITYSSSSIYLFSLYELTTKEIEREREERTRRQKDKGRGIPTSLSYTLFIENEAGAKLNRKVGLRDGKKTARCSRFLLSYEWL